MHILVEKTGTQAPMTAYAGVATGTIDPPKIECPLDFAILKLLIPGRKSLYTIEAWLKKQGRSTDSWEIRHKLSQLQSCGRVLVFVLPHETHDGIEVFGLSQAGFEALTTYLRATSNTEVRK